MRQRLLLAISFVMLAGVGRAQDTSHPVPVPGNAENGAALAQRWCSSCHVSGQGNRGSDAAPPFSTIARATKADPAHLRRFLSRPHGPMPPLQLTRQEISDLVAYFQSIAK